MTSLHKLILDTIDQHHQSVRNKRCECGWQPIFPQSKYGWEGQQHTEHLADVLAEVISQHLVTE